MKRFTTMTPAQFKRIRDGWIDGTLAAKWKDRTPTTKADQVENRQIRSIAMIFQTEDKMTRAILAMDWDLLEIVEGDDTKLEARLHHITRPRYSTRF